MTRKIILLLLFTLVTQASLSTLAFDGTSEEKIRKHSAKVQAAITKLGVGEMARAEVKLRDKTKLKGFIRSADGNEFVLVNPQTGIATTIEYSAVKQVKGNNLSTGAKILIGLGIAAGVLLFITLIFDD